jgi:uncharacterized protein (TIGR03067 family)
MRRSVYSAIDRDAAFDVDASESRSDAMMNWAARASAPLVAGLLIWFAPAAGQGQGKGKPSDQKQIQGNWTLYSQEIGGKQSPAEEIKGMKLKIAENIWTLSFGAGKATNHVLLAIDSSKDPKVIELRFPKGKIVWSGIYKLEGDTLTICRPVYPGGAAPKAFESSEEHMLWVWKRGAAPAP